jgi:hypothetical protein
LTRSLRRRQRHRYAECSCRSGHCRVLARYPLPNDPPALTERAPTPPPPRWRRTRISSQVRLDHKISAKDQFFARFNFDNLTGPTTNPDQTAVDPSFRNPVHRPPAQCGRDLDADATPRLTFESRSASRAPRRGFPPADSTDPAVKFNDGLYEAFNSAGGSVMQAYGNLFQGRENVAFTTARHAFKLGAESAAIATPRTSASAPTANTILAAEPRMRRRRFPRKRDPQHQARRSACPTRSPASFPAAPLCTRLRWRRNSSPAASTSVLRPSAATTSTPTSRTPGSSGRPSPWTTASAGSSTHPSLSAPSARRLPDD